MNSTLAEPLDPVFAALANPVRRSILSHLSERPLAMLELADRFDISFQAVSKHLKVLENAQLIIRRRKGKYHYFEYEPAAMKDAYRWMSFHGGFWKGSLDSLESFLQNSKLDQS